MSKDAYYFSHDSNAHDDPKIMLLIDQLGLEGYGIYWLLIEILRDQEQFRCQANLVPALASRYKTSSEKITAVISRYELFDHDDQCFWSPSLIRRMEQREIIRLAAVKAGKASAARRLLTSGQHESNERSTSVQQPFNVRSTLVEQGKERKGKKRKEKEKEIKDVVDNTKQQHGQFRNVLLTKEQRDSLAQRFGDSGSSELIEILSEGKESNGYHYRNDYAAALRWARKNNIMPVGAGNNGHAAGGANSYDHIKPLVSGPDTVEGTPGDQVKG